MKKIFRMLSLIAILTVAFTTQANEVGFNTDESCIVQDVGSDFFEFVTPSIDSGSPTLTKDKPISCLVANKLEFTDSVPIVFINTSDTSLNIEKQCKTKQSNGYESPDLIRDISTNVGKFNTHS